MPKKLRDDAPKRKTQVKDLPKQEWELSKDEQKKIKGSNWLMTPAGTAKPGGNPGGN